MISNNLQQPILPINTEQTLGTLIQHCNQKSKHLAPVDYLVTNNSMLRGQGSDPLDLILVYKNDDDQNLKHWHYVGFGLTDIYCLSKRLANLYPIPGITPQRISGYGFELTFRLRCHSEEDWQQKPPTWPKNIMQSLANYVFKSKNTFNVGDHVTWNRPLDDDDSKIEHILMTLDPTLQQVETCLGFVKFIQIVGIFEEELQAARRLNAKEVLEIMKQHHTTGGQLLVTDMRRGEDIFQLDPENRDRIDEGILRVGSDMIQFCTKHKYSSSKPKWYDDVESLQEGEEGNENFKYKPITPPPAYELANTRTPSRMSYESESALMIENAELVDTRYYTSVYLIMPYMSAKVLPIVLNGRLRHKKPFSFQSFSGDLLTTFVPEGASIDSLVNHEQPLAKKGTWLQIFITNQLREEMLELIGDDFAHDAAPRLPKNYSWPQSKLYITVVEEL